MDSNIELNRKKGMTTKIINGSLPDDSLKQKLELLRQKCLQSRDSNPPSSFHHTENPPPTANKRAKSKESNNIPKYDLSLPVQNVANEGNGVTDISHKTHVVEYNDSNTLSPSHTDSGHLSHLSDQTVWAVYANNSISSTDLRIAQVIENDYTFSAVENSTPTVAEAMLKEEDADANNAYSYQSLVSDTLTSSSKTNDFNFFGLSSSQELDFSADQKLADNPTNDYDYSKNDFEDPTNVEESHYSNQTSYEPENEFSHELDYSHYSVESKFEYDPSASESHYDGYSQSQYEQYGDETAPYDTYDYNQNEQIYETQEQYFENTPYPTQENPLMENYTNNNISEDYVNNNFNGEEATHTEPDLSFPSDTNFENYDYSYNSGYQTRTEMKNYRPTSVITHVKSEIASRPTTKLANILLASSSVDQTTESEDEAKKKRHLQIWGKFFENATAAYSNNDNIEISSDSDGPQIIKRNSKFVDYQSEVGKNYFTLAVAMEQSWPVLISSKKYLSLISLAKASVGAGDFTIPHMAMFAAIIKEDSDALNIFLMRGSNPNTSDIHGRNLSHHAARIGNVELLAMLVDNDCDMDRQDNEGYTPLHVAILFNRLSAIRFLLDCAVDVLKCSRDGENAINIAKRSNHFDCLQLLEDFLTYSTISSKDIPENPPSKNPNFLVSPDSSPLRKPNKDSLTTNDTVDSLRKRALLNRKVDFHISPVRQSSLTNSVEKFGFGEFEEKSIEFPPIDNGSENFAKISDGEEEEVIRESTNNFVDIIATYIWSFAISLINLSILLLTGSRPVERKLKSTNDQDEDKRVQSWKNSDAPPTDHELTQIGLGFSANRVTPPNDVQVAIAMSKVGRKLIDSPQGGGYPPTTSPVVEAHTNSYSLGQKLPHGVSWRYVNILDSNDDKQQH